MIKNFRASFLRLFSPEYLLLAGTFVFIIFFRLRYLNMPLERDEGEYAYMGQLILQGIPPYQIAYNMKLPGTYILFALFEAVFGQTEKGIHLGLLCATLASAAFVFLTVKKMISTLAASVAAAVYSVLSMHFAVLGCAAHATQFIVPFAMAGFLTLLHALEKKRRILFFLSGLFFGFSVLIKQAALPFCAWGILAVFSSGLNRNTLRDNVINALAVASGCALPFALTCLILYSVGVFDKFWFWTQTYMATYAIQIPLSKGLGGLCGRMFQIMRDFSGLWTTIFMGVILTALRENLHGKRMLLFSFYLFSFVSVCPGLYFRPHYFVPLFPAASIAAGVFFDSLKMRKAAAVILFSFFLGSGIFVLRDYFLLEDTLSLSHKLYKSYNPEMKKISEIVEKLTSQDERIAILGSEPQIYFYSKRKSATGYIYMYSIMEKQRYGLKMQKEMIREIETADPRIVVLIKNKDSWGRWPGAETYIFEWMDQFLAPDRYERIVVADIFKDKTVYRFEKEAETYKPLSKVQVHIYRKKA